MDNSSNLSLEPTCKLIKYALFVFNVIFVLAGIALITVGSVILRRIGKYAELFGLSVTAVPIIIIVIGVIMFMIAFFGCYGAMTEHDNMLIVYAVLTIIIVFILFVIGIVTNVYSGKIKRELKPWMYNSIPKYPVDTGVQFSWDALQFYTPCCGVTTYLDWARVNSTFIPRSCCPQDYYEKYKATKCTAIHAHKDGCYKYLLEYTNYTEDVVMAVSIALGCVLLIGAICACALASAIKRLRG